MTVNFDGLGVSAGVSGVALCPGHIAPLPPWHCRLADMQLVFSIWSIAAVATFWLGPMIVRFRPARLRSVLTAA